MTTREKGPAEATLNRFADALNQLTDDPPAVNVLRYLRASDELAHLPDDERSATAGELAHV